MGNQCPDRDQREEGECQQDDRATLGHQNGFAGFIGGVNGTSVSRQPRGRHPTIGKEAASSDRPSGWREISPFCLE
jgi:hypothetical protein